MNETLINCRDLGKKFRIYKKKSHRLLDFLGIGSSSRISFSEKIVLSKINFQVNRGEKVAIIGRNGAGKSTLLKIISGVLSPTSGDIQVSSKVNALLEIGSGFHEELTGRQNIKTYLAQLGYSSKEIIERQNEIIDFSEIESYIDQPLKTYSTGMKARLMFSASLSIAPELLILDEVLGVGDGYFVEKSFQRLRSLCSDENMTLLLVSHDLYSAEKICNRFIWIDQGQIIRDSNDLTALEAYKESISIQSESRLKMLTKMRAASGRVTINFDVLDTSDIDLIEVSNLSIIGPSGSIVQSLREKGEKSIKILSKSVDSTSDILCFRVDKKKSFEIEIEIPPGLGHFYLKVSFNTRFRYTLSVSHSLNDFCFPEVYHIDSDSNSLTLNINKHYESLMKKTENGFASLRILSRTKNEEYQLHQGKSYILELKGEKDMPSPGKIHVIVSKAGHGPVAVIRSESDVYIRQRSSHCFLIENLAFSKGIYKIDLVLKTDRSSNRINNVGHFEIVSHQSFRSEYYFYLKGDTLLKEISPII